VPGSVTLLIPRVFHQIWVGADPFPDEFARYQQTWLRHNPGWELRLWRDENLPVELRRPEPADDSRPAAERADILRLELLWRFGGIYFDTDFECLRPIEPLLDNVELFVGYRKPGRVNNALIGSVAGHRILLQALDAIPGSKEGGWDKDVTGPKFLDEQLGGETAVTFFEPHVFYPQTPDERGQAYAIHHQARSWKDREGLRRSLRKAEKRLLQAQEEARSWQLKYEAAEAELDRLRSGASGRFSARALGAGALHHRFRRSG
jgi:mannosyltransferase OCH1-like enzyme